MLPFLSKKLFLKTFAAATLDLLIIVGSQFNEGVDQIPGSIKYTRVSIKSVSAASNWH